MKKLLLLLGLLAANVFAQPTPVGSGVTQITAGTNVTISPTNGRGNVTVNAASSGGTVTSIPDGSTNGVSWTVANRTTIPAFTFTIAPAVTTITGLGTGVGAALQVNIGSAGAPVLLNGAGGTPTSLTGTNITGTAAGLTAGTASAVAVGGITGLGSNVATALAVNIGAAGAPVLFNGAGGTPTSMTGTNITGTAAGLTAGTASAVAVGGITGLGSNVATALAVNAGSSGAFLRNVDIDTNAELRAITVGLGAAVVSGTFTSPITTNPLTLTGTDCYGFILDYGATGTINLPAGVAGMNGIVYNTGAFTITIDPNGSEVVVRDGTAQTGGVSFTLSSGAGNFVALYFNGTQWITLGFKGVLAVGS